MRDIQNQADHRQIAIDKVGVCDLQYPIVVLDRKTKASRRLRDCPCPSVFHTSSKGRT